MDNFCTQATPVILMALSAALLAGLLLRTAVAVGLRRPRNLLEQGPVFLFSAALLVGFVALVFYLGMCESGHTVPSLLRELSHRTWPPRG